MVSLLVQSNDNPAYYVAHVSLSHSHFLFIVATAHFTFGL